MNMNQRIKNLEDKQGIVIPLNARVDDLTDDQLIYILTGDPTAKVEDYPSERIEQLIREMPDERLKEVSDFLKSHLEQQ